MRKTIIAGAAVLALTGCSTTVTQVMPRPVPSPVFTQTLSAGDVLADDGYGYITNVPLPLRPELAPYVASEAVGISDMRIQEVAFILKPGINVQAAQDAISSIIWTAFDTSWVFTTDNDIVRADDPNQS